MDYSTISNKTSCTEAEDLTNDELSVRYFSLKKQYDNLVSNFDAIKQELHDTKRSYQTALDVQSHLNEELESYQIDEERRNSELTTKISYLNEEITQLRDERTEITERHCIEIKKLETQIRNFKEEQTLKARESPERDNTAELEEIRNVAKTALSDVAIANAALDEARMEIASWRLKTEELINEIGEMRASADLRREELRAASDREATALAELSEAKAMLHQYTDPQDLQPHATKGNSIFAEVEDKRQEMAKNVIQMKQTNSRLRRELANKQAEVDSLLHEKQTIWEQQAGAAAHYDRELIESYEERITQVEGTCEKQRRELARWFGKLCEPTANGWLPGVLDHLKSECEQLRAEVQSRGVAQLASATQIRELRRKVALLTASSARPLPHTEPPTTTVENGHHAAEALIPKIPLQVKSKSTPDDVKKKVSFN